MIKFRHSKNQAFYDYWCQLPKTGIMPDKNSFKPEDIPALLATMVVYELVSDDFIRIRLIGSVVEERFGGHRTGTNYLDVVEEHRKASASAAFWTQAEKRCGMHVLLEQELKSGRIAYIEAVGLPVQNVDGGNPLLLFQNNEISGETTGALTAGISTKEQQKFEDKENRMLKYIRVVERSYFDLEMAVPDLCNDLH